MPLPPTGRRSRAELCAMIKGQAAPANEEERGTHEAVAGWEAVQVVRSVSARQPVAWIIHTWQGMSLLNHTSDVWIRANTV